MGKGSFTLPGESGYEDLTLELAEKWGADVIRDSDGTQLSDQILNAGYDIYSTICVIRGHNDWARKNPNALQQCFLMSIPVTATNTQVNIELLKNYRKDQFQINNTPESLKYWQIFDRTEEKELSWNFIEYDALKGNVLIKNTIPYHTYTVNFLAYRIWEEISMYNSITNHLNTEHLMPIDPRLPEAQEYFCQWMDQWCASHPQTTVVRFTSMFYNFVWIWGDDARHENFFTDWGSYDFTVSPTALAQFESEYGYALTSEDFINQGKFHSNNLPPTKKLRDYIQFTNKFVVSFGKKLIEIVHSYHKKAYMFYDDSWVGTEPYIGTYQEFGFDGLIKCVFNGYEVRQCANVEVPVHEIRLHPYLFPTGLNGAPTFMKGGDPVTPAKEYWIKVRRALLRQTVDRIGLGGYLHLVQDFPEFCNVIEHIADEFRQIKALQKSGAAYTLPIQVSILTSWGKIRTWSLSGNFRETCMHDLIHVIEALSGLPVNVNFVDFQDIKNDVLQDTDVLINAGRAGLSWTGGDAWNAEIVEEITEWVYNGGTFLGINEPSAVEGGMNFFRMAQVLGVDYDTGAYTSHGRWSFHMETIPEFEGMVPVGADLPCKDNICLLSGDVKVLMQKDGLPVLTIHDVGKGKGIYLSSFREGPENDRLLLNLLLYSTGMTLLPRYSTDNPYVECAYYPSSKTLIVVNNSPEAQNTAVTTGNDVIGVSLNGYETKIMTDIL